MESPAALLVGALGVWRVTYLLYAEDGPGRILARLRRAAGAGVVGDVLECFYCLSLWVAAPFAVLLGAGWGERLLVWPALSAAAILFERFTARPDDTRYVEDSEVEEHVLRSASQDASRHDGSGRRDAAPP